ncbi:MAG TPA: ATP-binding protein [Verrucomicrobiae bacterium]|nr:ATP-binding protein [Verrucomicrobiae bacterium]
MSEAQERSPKLDAATLEWIDRFAPYGVIATDRELRVRTWNHWMEVHSGRRFDSVAGLPLLEIFPDLAKRRLLPHFERALKGEVSVVSSALHGYLFPLNPASRENAYEFMQQTARLAPLTIAGEIVGTIVVVEDVTQREWQAEILRRQHARDEVLSWALAHLLKAEDSRRTTRDVFCKVAEHLDFDTYCLHLYDPETNSYRLTSSGGISPEKETEIQLIPESKLAWIQETRDGGPLVREQVQSSDDPRVTFGKKLGFRAYVALPLLAGSTQLGMLCFATRTRDNVAPSETDLLGAIGQYLAVALNREKTDRELREAQELLNAHAHQLEQNVAERTASLKQIIAELQTFSYTIAHDLRAPIRALKGYCEVLIEDYSDDLPEDAKKIVQRLRTQSVQMDALTRDLLEFSKVSRQDITLARVNLKEVISETVTVAGSIAAACVQVQEPLHTAIANRTLVSQCISNLLENALKFCKPGLPPSVKVWSELRVKTKGDPETAHFSRSRYSLSEAAPDDYFAHEDNAARVRLWFEDNGIGISTEAQKKIFGIFERGDSAGEYDGTGIGLAIVARAMERMGGNCGVVSTLGEGSRFWLEFRSPD